MRRTPAPEDQLDNLRSLCATHNAQVKEHKHGPDGVRRRPSAAARSLKGCDRDGWPLARKP